MKDQIILEDFYKNRDIRVYKDYSPTIRSERTGLLIMIMENLMKVKDLLIRIRKLTESECFVLMGLTKEDCDKCKDVGVSASQLYKQAGNGIVTNCVKLLFEHLYKSQYDQNYECFDEKFIREHNENFIQAAMT